MVLGLPLVNQNACVPLSNAAEASCVSASCSTHSQDKEESRRTQDSSVAQDINTQRDKWNAVEKDNEQLGGVIGNARKTEDWKGDEKRSKEERVLPESHPRIQQGSPQPLEGMDDSGIP